MVKIIFGADTKAWFANYFQKDKIQFFSVHCPAHLYYVYSGFCHKLSGFLAIIDEYDNWLSSDLTIWYNLTKLKDLVIPSFSQKTEQLSSLELLKL